MFPGIISLESKFEKMLSRRVFAGSYKSCWLQNTQNYRIRGVKKIINRFMYIIVKQIQGTQNYVCIKQSLWVVIYVV